MAEFDLPGFDFGMVDIFFIISGFVMWLSSSASFGERVARCS